MKNILMLLLFFNAEYFCSQTKEEFKINVRNVNDIVYVLNLDVMNSTNVIVINSEKGIIIIDTEVTPIFADKIKIV